MGNLCSCDDNPQNAAYHQTILNEEQLKRKDPVIQELCQHLRMINQKLENNLTAINDFKQLLLQSREEIVIKQKSGKKDPKIAQMIFFYGSVLKKVEMVLGGFDEAKHSIKLVGSKNSQVKQMLDILEKDLNSLRNRSRRHQIQSTMNLPTSNSSIPESQRNFDLQLIQSGLSLQHTSPAEYPSLNSHGAQSSMMANTLMPQLSHEENDILLQKDNIYKKVSDLFGLLKQAEDEAQVQMLNWENFVIQQEKMQKLRDDILKLTDQSVAKLDLYRGRIDGLKQTVIYFSKTCEIVGAAISKLDVNNKRMEGGGSRLQHHPMSPISKGDGTTVSTDRDQDLLGGKNPEQPYSSMLQDRRSLSIGSGHELGSCASNASLVSDVHVHENIDLDETEQSQVEVQALKKQISVFEGKIAKSVRVLQKRDDEMAKQSDKISGEMIYQLDIYELDFLHNSMTDFLNNLEMTLLKLGTVQSEIESIRQNQSLLDFCENVCNRQFETQLCVHRLKRLIKRGTELQKFIAEQPSLQQQQQEQQSELQFDHLNLKDSCKEMLIRLNHTLETMTPNMTLIQRVKDSNINVESHSDLSYCLQDLASASNRCKDANRVVLDMMFRFSQLYTLCGCYGRIIHTQPLYGKKQSHMEQLRVGLQQSQRLIDNQLRTCNQFSSYGTDSPMNKKLSFFSEEDLSKDHDLIIEAVRQKTQSLQNQNRLAMDYLGDIEAQLETWLASQEDQSGSFNVMENVDEEDQERPVQELILIDRSIGKLVLLVEKIDILIEKNDRLLNKATIKIKLESLTKLSERLLNDLTSQSKQQIKIEDKIKAYYQHLQAVVQANKSSTANGPSELEEKQMQMHSASKQLNNLDSIISMTIQKETLAKNLRDDLVEAKEQITTKMYKNVQQYLHMFVSEIVERDPSIDQISEQILRSQLAQSPSLGDISARVPLTNLNRQISNIDKGLQNLSTELKRITDQMRQVAEYAAKMGDGKAGGHQRKRSISNNLQTPGSHFPGAAQQPNNRQRSMTPRSQPNAEASDEDGGTTVARNSKPDTTVVMIEEGETGQNGLVMNVNGSQSDWSSDYDGLVEMRDEIDLAIQKCLEDQTSLKKLKMKKVAKGQYLLENKQFTMRLLQGNNLAIRMHAGYIYADCLVHFEEELYKIVK